MRGGRKVNFGELGEYIIPTRGKRTIRAGWELINQVGIFRNRTLKRRAGDNKVAGSPFLIKVPKQVKRPSVGVRFRIIDFPLDITDNRVKRGGSEAKVVHKSTVTTITLPGYTS